MKLPTRNDFPRLLNQLGLTTRGAEIGVFKGKFSELLMRGTKFNEFFGIDQWKPIPDYAGARYQWSAQEWQGIYRKAANLLAQFKQYKILRRSSKEASEMFEDEYFDFVYLDGDHRYEGIVEDINAWLPKVRKGGMLAGDDYRDNDLCGVKQAVDEIFGDKATITEDGKNWFVIREDI